MHWKWALLIFPLFTIIKITEVCLTQPGQRIAITSFVKTENSSMFSLETSGHKDPRELPLPLGDLRISIITMMQCVISGQGTAQDRRVGWHRPCTGEPSAPFPMG